MNEAETRAELIDPEETRNLSLVLISIIRNNVPVPLFAPVPQEFK